MCLMNNSLILSQIEEVTSELGEPDCKLIEPFVINQETGELIPWFVDCTNQNEFMIHSDKILTIMTPNGKFIEKYENLLKE